MMNRFQRRKAAAECRRRHRDRPEVSDELHVRAALERLYELGGRFVDVKPCGCFAIVGVDRALALEIIGPHAEAIGAILRRKLAAIN